MKKTGQIIYIPILLLVFFSRSLSDPGTSILQLDTENAKNYLSPMGTMLGAGMNTGYFQKASVYKKNGFDVTLDLAFVMFPPQRTTYDFIVPETPINVLFPFKFPKNYLKYKHSALLEYIPETDTDGIFYEDNISITMPLNTLLFSELVATVIGVSNPDTLEFDFDRANRGNVLYNQMLERVWSEVQNIKGIGKEYYLYNEEDRLITILSPAYEDAESFREDFSEQDDVDLLGTLQSTLDTMNLDLILPGGFDYLFNELPLSDGMPLPIIQATIGLPNFSEISVRASPLIPISSIGSIQYVSLGGKVAITNHLSKLLNLSPRYENYLDISSYTKIFSSNIRPKDVKKVLNDFKKYDLEIHEIDSLNTLFRQGNPQVVREMQHKIQEGLLKVRDMPKAQKDEDENQLPLDMSFGYYINYFKFDMGGSELNAINKIASIQIGKSFEPRFISWFGGMGIYSGVGFESSNINLIYKYTDTLGDSDDASVSFSGENTFRGLIGTRIRILNIDLYIDYNIGESNAINAGFGIKFK